MSSVFPCPFRHPRFSQNSRVLYGVPGARQNLISPFLCDLRMCRNRMRSYLTSRVVLRGFVICTLRCDLGSNHS